MYNNNISLHSNLKCRTITTCENNYGNTAFVGSKAPQSESKPSKQSKMQKSLKNKLAVLNIKYIFDI